MVKLGSDNNPLTMRVQTWERFTEVAAICKEHGWKYFDDTLILLAAGLWNYHLSYKA